MFHNLIFHAGYVGAVCVCMHVCVCGCALYDYSNVTEPEKHSLGFAYHPLLNLTFCLSLDSLSFTPPCPKKGLHIARHIYLFSVLEITVSHMLPAVHMSIKL